VSHTRYWYWRQVTLLILRLPIYAIGLYAIYRFAAGSLKGAIIVAALVTVWLIGSLIWVYVIWPRLQKRRAGISS
jgi:hypothetical protein